MDERFVRTVKHRLVYVLALMVGACSLVGCDKPNDAAWVYVTYEQLANFPDYRTPQDSDSSFAFDGVYVLYKITKIVNTGSAAAPFAFKRNNISAVAPNGDVSNDWPSAEFQLLGAKLVPEQTIQPGATVNNPGCFIRM